MSSSGDWTRSLVGDWKGFKSLARRRVLFEIESRKEASYPVELEVACFLRPLIAILHPVAEIPGSVFYFKGIINDASDYSAFLENELDPYEIPVEHGIGIQYYWHDNAGADYRKEIEAREHGLPPPFGDHPGSEYRKELDRKLQPPPQRF